MSDVNKFTEKEARVGRVFYFTMHIKPKMERLMEHMKNLEVEESQKLVAEIDKSIKEYSKVKE